MEPIEEHQIAALEHLLHRWAIWCRHWQPDLGYPKGAVWAKLYAARHPVCGDEAEADADSWELHALDATIGDLPKPSRLVVELKWLSHYQVPEKPLLLAYGEIVGGLTKRNVLL